MNKFTPAESELLERIREKEELRPFFFRKAKELKWFDALNEQGYFNPENIPRPAPAEEQGYVTVAHWPAIEYLLNASTELEHSRNEEYAVKFLNVIRSATSHAIENNLSNYRVWWQFAKIIQNIPVKHFCIDDIRHIKHWLADPYDRSLSASEVGEKWLPRLIDDKSESARSIAIELIDFLFKPTSLKSDGTPIERRQDVVLRISSHEAREIKNKVSSKSGQLLGLPAVQVFQRNLESIVVALGHDKWSAIWRASIADHEQNHSIESVEDVILEGYRDSLLSYVKAHPIDALQYVDKLFRSNFQTIQRVAVHAVDECYRELQSLQEDVINDTFFESNFRHETWKFLEAHYATFPAPLKQRVLEVISRVSSRDVADNDRVGVVAYQEAVWLSAIQGVGAKELALYKARIETIGVEPENPDFSSYMSVGWVDHKSPFTIQELADLSAIELAAKLEAYIASSIKTKSAFDEVGVEGLLKAFRQIIRSSPLLYSGKLAAFETSAFSVTHQIIQAYQDLWREQAQLPWDSIWTGLLEFCRNLVAQSRFWAAESEAYEGRLIANSNWIAGSIGQLIESGTRSDAHAFNPELLPLAKDILDQLLSKQEGVEFKPDDDAVSVAINSARGHCIEAKINLALRTCRLEDKLTGDHSKAWLTFENFFSRELAKTGKGGFEFATLAAQYLPNFLFLSKEWVAANLEKIFDKEDLAKWRCAMQGYSYVNVVSESIYEHLKTHGHILRALDDESLKHHVTEKLIQNIAISYLRGNETLESPNSMINILLERRKYSELSEFIWFIWTLRNRNDQELILKVFDIWHQLIAVMDTEVREGKRLASKLSMWADFITEINDRNRPLILKVAAFADIEHNAYHLLESIARISTKQPMAAYEIWTKILEKSKPDYPEDAIRTLLKNIAMENEYGVIRAKNIADLYLKAGNDRPHQMLGTILK